MLKFIADMTCRTQWCSRVLFSCFPFRDVIIYIQFLISSYVKKMTRSINESVICGIHVIKVNLSYKDKARLYISRISLRGACRAISLNRYRTLRSQTGQDSVWIIRWISEYLSDSFQRLCLRSRCRQIRHNRYQSVRLRIYPSRYRRVRGSSET